MQSLEQIRAAGALKAAGAKKTNGKPLFSRADVAGLPALILSNGLLSAVAFACEKDKDTRAGMNAACEATAKHLALNIHGISVLRTVANGTQLVAALSKDPATSLDVQRATAESLAFLSYLKRFAEPAE
jgi:CRISPR/Cas system CMR-associated protein Cmr5 small subunit